MKAVKKFIEVKKDKSVTVKYLPFKPGSKVEVIVIQTESKEDVFDYMNTIVKKKKISPKSLKEVERIVHEARGLK
ncbi:MAG: hypothetical protein DYG83_01140 [Candidatus Brocadia sp. AMX2]|uniref:Beta-glucosidase-related glycosidases n=1 Tax=Candidatus Brocadia sinica JPN1 TaxID=1197129 RepID=A0ABQ0JVM8_9BACT|nr:MULTISPECIES: hypothetical protein [Brocadia]MBC6930753.1 hypothetical protein [Candidatus Brocadia sp.]MBL1167722.1 hypothetical protein [Candidatus Brocadia sp. AMX1]NOG41335.1 hypothetical protein [Planctomycetota bacterium]GIK13659.1 MAG: hypothetical protein BroJett002_23660 [Candidatus Brocadia sinica]KAA0245605.1 MAG: hypothetical protein EDM70_01595 [Candidatus Brocadia sp. AMX2]